MPTKAPTKAELDAVAQETTQAESQEPDTSGDLASAIGHGRLEQLESLNQSQIGPLQRVCSPVRVF